MIPRCHEDLEAPENVQEGTENTIEFRGSFHCISPFILKNHVEAGDYIGGLPTSRVCSPVNSVKNMIQMIFPATLRSPVKSFWKTFSFSIAMSFQRTDCCRNI